MAVVLQHHVLGLLKHDIVITGTDGLWDNVWPQQIAQLATAYQQRGSAPYTAAGQIAEYARQMYAPDHPYGAVHVHAGPATVSSRRAVCTAWV